MSSTNCTLGWGAVIEELYLGYIMPFRLSVTAIVFGARECDTLDLSCLASIYRLCSVRGPRQVRCQAGIRRRYTLSGL
jgi:hypothetical protein